MLFRVLAFCSKDQIIRFCSATKVHNQILYARVVNCGSRSRLPRAPWRMGSSGDWRRLMFHSLFSLCLTLLLSNRIIKSYFSMVVHCRSFVPLPDDDLCIFETSYVCGFDVFYISFRSLSTHSTGRFEGRIFA